MKTKPVIYYSFMPNSAVERRWFATAPMPSGKIARAFGSTKAEALGSLVEANPDLFGITLTEVAK